ncbi:MAG: hypothetical protein U9O85_10870 [Euryarchaeota archaeon]|nr:hypothetical protein [Euryarchaeota archaeon]
MGEENRDVKTEDYSLSTGNWMTVLSSEINRYEAYQSQVLSTIFIVSSILIAFVIGLLSYTLSALNLLVDLNPDAPDVVVVDVLHLIGGMTLPIYAIFLFVEFREILKVGKKIKNHVDMRNEIIIGKLPDPIARNKKWKDYNR